jgi:hypothetical protein
MPSSEASLLEAYWRYEVGPKLCAIMLSVAPSSWLSSRVSASPSLECWLRTLDSKYHHYHHHLLRGQPPHISVAISLLHRSSAFTEKVTNRYPVVSFELGFRNYTGIKNGVMSLWAMLGCSHASKPATLPVVPRYFGHLHSGH